jgi:hypothetical protein
VFVMCPPAAACVPVWLYAKVARGSYVIDAHTATFVDARWKALSFIQRFFCRHAATTLVTNTHWQSLVQSWNARSDIVADVPVAFPPPHSLELGSGPKIAVIPAARRRAVMKLLHGLAAVGLQSMMSWEG